MIRVSVGTSIEAFAGSWRERLTPRIGEPLIDRSLGGGAYTRANTAGDTIRAHVDAALAELHPDVLILGGPVNDLVSLDTSKIGDLCWAVQNTVSAAQAAGVTRVVLCGIMPFTDGAGALAPGWWPNLEQRRAAYNSWAASAGRTEGPFVTYADDAAAVLATPGTTRADPRWFADGLHPNPYGAVLRAEAFPVEQLNPSVGSSS